MEDPRLHVEENRLCAMRFCVSQTSVIACRVHIILATSVLIRWMLVSVEYMHPFAGTSRASRCHVCVCACVPETADTRFVS